MRSFNSPGPALCRSAGEALGEAMAVLSRCRPIPLLPHRRFSSTDEAEPSGKGLKELLRSPAAPCTFPPSFSTCKMGRKYHLRLNVLRAASAGAATPPQGITRWP